MAFCFLQGTYELAHCFESIQLSIFKTLSQFVSKYRSKHILTPLVNVSFAYEKFKLQ